MSILILKIVLALIAVFVLAYVILKFVPKKLQWIINLVLLGVIVWLSYMIVGSITKPIRFAKEKKARYTKVINNLKMIRDAEVLYEKATNKHTADKNALIRFIDTGSIPVIERKTVVKKVRRGTITVDKEVVVENVIGHTPVKASFAGRDYKNMFSVNLTNKKKEAKTIDISIKTDSVELADNLYGSTFLAEANKSAVLFGMDDYLVAEENESKGGTEVKGKTITVGSLTDVKDTGNWPPFYDANDKKKKK